MACSTSEEQRALVQVSRKFATKQSRKACWWSVVLQTSRQMSRVADLHPGDFPRSLPRSAISGEGASACTCSWSSAAEPRSGRWLSGWTFYLHRNIKTSTTTGNEWKMVGLNANRPTYKRSLFYFMLCNAQNCSESHDLLIQISKQVMDPKKVCPHRPS